LQAVDETSAFHNWINIEKRGGIQQKEKEKR
jgi:hypothetical protein